MPLEPSFWHYAAEIRTTLHGSVLINTMDNLSEMCPLTLTNFCLFCTINHTQYYKGRLFPQWLSQVVITGAQTCYPQMGEPASALTTQPIRLTYMLYLTIAAVERPFYHLRFACVKWRGSRGKFARPFSECSILAFSHALPVHIMHLHACSCLEFARRFLAMNRKKRLVMLSS